MLQGSCDELCEVDALRNILQRLFDGFLRCHLVVAEVYQGAHRIFYRLFAGVAFELDGKVGRVNSRQGGDFITHFNDQPLGGFFAYPRHSADGGAVVGGDGLA